MSGPSKGDAMTALEEISERAQSTELKQFAVDYLASIPDTDRSTVVYSSAAFLAVAQLVDERAAEAAA